MSVPQPVKSSWTALFLVFGLALGILWSSCTDSIPGGKESLSESAGDGQISHEAPFDSKGEAPFEGTVDAPFPEKEAEKDGGETATEAKKKEELPGPEEAKGEKVQPKEDPAKEDHPEEKAEPPLPDPPPTERKPTDQRIPDHCLPKTCADLGRQCGKASNGCGGTLQCGTCKAPAVCLKTGKCCRPKTCASLKRECGSVSNGCGGTLRCGSCKKPKKCNAAGKCELPLLPAANFWPLPNNKRVYWWVYRWKDGGATLCPNKISRKVGISARYYNDGAFGAASPSLLSINFFKEHVCTYWEPRSQPSQDMILRWYSRGFRPSATTIYDREGKKNYSKSFLSFRGDSRWTPDRSQSTVFRGTSGAVRHRVNGRYATKVQGVFAYKGGNMYTFVDGDFPIYGVLPDRPLSANVIVTRKKVPDQLDDVGKYCNYPKTQAGWSAQRSNPQQCTWSAPIKWAVYFRRTSYTYQGKQVIYAGFSETLDSGSTGACEEWWFAEGVGPLYIAAYPVKNWSDCKKVLAATSQGGLVDNPPLHFQKRKASLRGWLELVESCLGVTCKVDI